MLKVFSRRLRPAARRLPRRQRCFAAASSVAADGGEKGLPPVGHQNALFALPLYRKPAFPGFYHVVQIGDQDILDFLRSLRRQGQAEHLAGFMTLDLPEGLSEGDEGAAEPLVAVPPAAAAAEPVRVSSDGQAIRRDTGPVQSGKELESIGTLLQLVSLSAHPTLPGGQAVVMPMRRIRNVRTMSKPSPGMPLCAVFTESVPDVVVPPDSDDVRALHHEIIATMKDLLKTPFMYKEQFEQVIKYYSLDDPLKLADLAAGMSTASREELQAVLEECDAAERLRKVLVIVKKDLENAKLQSQLKSQIEDKFVKDHRKYVLMQHLKHIKKELNLEKDDKQSILASFKEAIKKLVEVPAEAAKAMSTELGKIQNLEPASPEFNVSRSYLEWMTALPWSKTTDENDDITRAEAVLNEDHYGLEDVKERILEHMAVNFLKGSTSGKIICLVGPPGVGKTSVGKSIARALDRKFFRFSVGGLHDVAEIRGHRRTYVGAMPGKVIQALKITGTSNPVILIDEVDKLGRDMRGDPASALLEALDPEQNKTFRDLYVDAPVDLSRVLFVCTANVLDTIPPPLLDRMETIRIAGYVFEEKLAIAKQYLLPKMSETNGVTDDHLDISEEAVRFLIRDYAREAGVRELEKLLGKIGRKTALEYVRRQDDAWSRTNVTLENLTDFVGQPPHSSEQPFPDGAPPGVVRGLAWTALGGKTLLVEVRGRVPRGRKAAKAAGERRERRQIGTGPRMKVTGRVGKVMDESSQIALTFARLFMKEVEPQAPNTFLEEATMHMHVPDGATPKDGPSAGVTMTSALLSLALDRPVRHDVAMTGEMTLSGKVLRVGGIKEKALACRRENVGNIVMPMSNQADFLEIQPHLRAGLTAHFVDHYDDVYRLAFEGSGAPMPAAASRGKKVVTLHSAEEPGDLEGQTDRLPSPTTPGLPAVAQLGGAASRRAAAVGGA